MKKNIVALGKRKTAIARATIKEGTGRILVNQIPYENLREFHKLLLLEPINITKKVLGKFNFDVWVNVRGGGREGQIEAGRLALGKALVEITDSKKLKDALENYDRTLLVADIRRKEPNKPGDSKARSKRQKSYR